MASVLRPGFLKVVQGALRIVEDGACHGGPPCSSFIWLNKGTSKRSMKNVMGDLSQRTVVESNAIPESISVTISRIHFLALFCHAWITWVHQIFGMDILELSGSTFVLRIMARFCLVVILCICRCVHVTLEQPRSSIMKFVKYFKWIAKALGRRVAWQVVN